MPSEPRTAPPLPMPLDELRHYSSVQILHKIQQSKVGSSSPQRNNLSSVCATRSASRSGEGLSALVRAGGRTAQLSAVDVLQQLLNKQSQALPDTIITAQLNTSPAPEFVKHRDVSLSPPKRPPPVSGEVVAQLYRAIVDRRPESVASRSSGPMICCDSPFAEEFAQQITPPQSPGAVSTRQRQLQVALWKKIAYGDSARAQSPTRHSPSDRCSSVGRTADELGGSLRRVPSSRGSCVGASPTGNASFRLGASREGSLRLSSPGSLRGSFRMRGDMQDMPTPEEVNTAFAAAQRYFAAKSLRTAVGLLQPSLEDAADEESALQSRGSSVSDVLHEQARLSVLACAIARDVSVSDVELQRTFHRLTPFFAREQDSPWDTMQLRSVGCEGPLRWALLSNRLASRSTMLCAVALDPCAVGFCEYPGTGRSGTAALTTVVLGSKLEMLQDEAVRQTVLQGMLGLESIGRAVISFHGPMSLERTHMQFSEGMARASLDAQWSVSLQHLIVTATRRFIAAEKTHEAVLSGTAGMRAEHDEKRWSVSGRTRELMYIFARRCLSILADERATRISRETARRAFQDWRDNAAGRVRHQLLQQSVLQSVSDFRKDRRLAAAEELCAQWQLRNLRDVYHVFFIRCMRRKCSRHLSGLTASCSSPTAQSATLKKEAVVAQVALHHAKRVARAITAYARTQGGVFPITLTGHSSAGAVALLAACLINAEASSAVSVRRVVTFGAPKVFRQCSTELLQSLGVAHIAVLHQRDPAPHQPWTFDASGVGGFVISSSAVHFDVKTAPATLQPTPWSEVPPVAATAAAHWHVFHSLSSYVAFLAPEARQAAALRGAPTFTPAALEAQLEKVEFEARVLQPSPARGASHGFTSAMMRCLQHVSTRYGVGQHQRVPRDLLLGVIGVMSHGSPMDVTAERLPVGQGGRLDQTTFVSWLWQETVISPEFTASFLAALKYEYNGKDFFPSQKALVTPPPPPKVMPVPALVQSAEDVTLSTVGRSAVASLFRSYARPVALSPLEFRLPRGAPCYLLSHHCLAQVLAVGKWKHRATPLDAVAVVFQQVFQAHLASLQEAQQRSRLPSYMQPTGGTQDADLEASEQKPPLVSYSGELTERGTHVFFQLFVRLYGIVPLQCALVELGYNPRLWTPSLSKTVDISFDIHWKYGPCPCLQDEAERRRVHAEEESKFKQYASKLATDIMLRRRQSMRPTGPESAIDVTASPNRASQRQPSLWWAGEAVSPSNASHHSSQSADVLSPTNAASLLQRWDMFRSVLATSADAVVTGDVTAPHTGDAELKGSPLLITQAAVGAADTQHGASVSPVRRDELHSPVSLFDSTLYSNRSHVAQWVARGNGKKLRRDEKKALRQFVHEDRSLAGTSFGDRPRRRMTPQQRAQSSTSLRDPSVNSLPLLSAMYSTQNTLRILNPAQRRVLQLPPLTNQLLDPQLEPL